MGNCIRHESPMQWGGDDWSSAVTGPEEGEDEDEEPAAHKGLPPCARKVKDSRSLAAAAEIVKVRITKRQLAELLGKVDVKELSARQAVAQLLSAAAASHHRPWRPALQSIPEGN